MSLDLARALHDAVDGPPAGGAGRLGVEALGADGLGVDALAHVARRVFRRRAARAAVRAGVGVTAGVAVTVGAVQLTGRGPTAAGSGAAAGACGSVVSDIATTGDGPAVTVRPAHGVHPGAGADLGAGEGLDIEPGAGARLGRAGAQAWSPEDGLLGEGRLALDVEYRFTAGADGTVEPPRVVVARDGVVVATVRPDADEAVGWSVGGESMHQAGFVLDTLLEPCDGTAPGPLPAGGYTLHAIAASAPDAQDAWQSVSAPVPLGVGKPSPRLTGLPAGFPDVPIVGVRVVDASELAGTGAGSWTAVVAVEGIDAAEQAWRALGSPTGELTSPDGAWTVTLRNDVLDGQSVLVYRLDPR